MGRLLPVVAEVLGDSGVERDAILVLSAEAPEGGTAGLRWEVHDAEDASARSYLASTDQGRRLYLNRHLTNADLVIPIGELRFDPLLGHEGPWSVVFPGLIDRETRDRVIRDSVGSSADASFLDEAQQVNWLLGSLFSIGVIASADGGIGGVYAGAADVVTERGIAETDRGWGLAAPEPADLVLGGVGRPGRSTRWADLARALAAASPLVRRGGRIVLLSDLSEGPSPALQALASAESPREWRQVLADLPETDDEMTARLLARCWPEARVSLLSRLDSTVVEDLGFSVIDRPEMADRLIEGAGSITVLNRADRVRILEEAGSR